MRGSPKYLNTRADYDYMRAHFAAEVWRPYWQELLDSRFVWQISGTLGDGEDGIEDATHRMQVEQDYQGNEVRYQMKLVEDAHAKIFRLGLTVAEVEEALG